MTTTAHNMARLQAQSRALRPKYRELAELLDLCAGLLDGVRQHHPGLIDHSSFPSAELEQAVEHVTGIIRSTDDAIGNLHELMGLLPR